MYTIIDTETTGLSPKSCRVIEIGALKINQGKIVGEFSALVKTINTIPSFTANFTGITTSILEQKGEDPYQVFSKLQNFLGKDIFVAHNVYFDFHFINQEFMRYGLPIMQNKRICTRLLAKAGLPDLKNHKLTTIKDHFKLTYQSHRALTDAYTSYHILQKFLPLAKIYDQTIEPQRYALFPKEIQISSLTKNTPTELTNKPRILFLIDGHNYLWRAFSASKQVTQIFMSLIKRSLRAIYHSPKEIQLLVLFDGANSLVTNRTLFKDYKSNRQHDFPEGEAPWDHLPKIKKALTDQKIKYIETVTYEADDLIATLSTEYTAKDSNNQVYLCSADTDLYQLVNKQITQLHLGKYGQPTRLMTPTKIKEKLDVFPFQYVGFKALVGDPSDNIPGIKGLGKKRAAQVMNKQREWEPTNDDKIILKRNVQLIKLDKKVNHQVNF